MDKIFSFLTVGVYGTIRETFANDMQHTGYTIVTNSLLIGVLFALTWFMYHDKVSANGAFVKVAEVQAMVEQIRLDAAHRDIRAQINSLLDQNADFNTRLIYVESPNERRTIEALIDKNESRIEQLRHEEGQIDD